MLVRIVLLYASRRTPALTDTDVRMLSLRRDRARPFSARKRYHSHLFPFPCRPSHSSPRPPIFRNWARREKSASGEGDGWEGNLKKSFSFVLSYNKPKQR